MAKIEQETMMEGDIGTMSCCANCGIKEGDDVHLKMCNACKSTLVWPILWYQISEGARAEHKQACKKRAAEIRDEILFQQPESSNLGDCPICCLPLSIDENECGYSLMLFTFTFSM